MALPFEKAFEYAASALGVVGNLIDDVWDTKSEKAERDLQRKEIKARVDVANLAIELAKKQAEIEYAKAVGAAASAQQAGKSWMQRTLFPVTTYALIGMLGAHLLGYMGKLPVEVWVIWLGVAGGGVISQPMMEWVRTRGARKEKASV